MGLRRRRKLNYPSLVVPFFSLKNYTAQIFSTKDFLFFRYDTTRDINLAKDNTLASVILLSTIYSSLVHRINRIRAKSHLSLSLSRASRWYFVFHNFHPCLLTVVLFFTFYRLEGCLNNCSSRLKVVL